MSQVNQGDKVRVDFTGWLKDGTVFATSHDTTPFCFTIGKREVIQEFENAVLGMQPGETRTIEIDAVNGYGIRRDDLVWELPRDQLGRSIDDMVGERVNIDSTDESIEVTVVKVTPTKVVLDANHPLAGQDMTLEIRLVAVD